MNVCVFDAVVEFIGDYLFSIAVCEEINGTGWNDTDKGRTKTFEESRDTFVFVNIPETIVR